MKKSISISFFCGIEAQKTKLHINSDNDARITDNHTFNSIFLKLLWQRTLLFENIDVAKQIYKKEAVHNELSLMRAA